MDDCSSSLLTWFNVFYHTVAVLSFFFLCYLNSIVWVYEESSNLFNAEEGRKEEGIDPLARVYLVSCIVVYDVRYDDFPSPSPPHPHPHPSLMMNN